MRSVLRFLILCLCLVAAPEPSSATSSAKEFGTQKLLAVMVRFPGTPPTTTPEQIQEKAARVARYINAASYGKVRIEPHVVGWYDMPDPLFHYEVSPRNFEVDRARVRKLMADALGAARADGIDLSSFDQVWIVVGARTAWGQGYGMIAYCANPGMLTMSRGWGGGFETVELRGGGNYGGPAVVSAENAHIGHVSHDLLHALGGVEGDRWLVPDLYDFQLQSHPPAGRTLHPALFAIHAGPWDIMSQHFIEWHMPPPQPSAFTRLQLGWIEANQVQEVMPGETREVDLSPLAMGKGILAVRIPLGGVHSLLLENRQRIGGDRILPSDGLLVSRVDTSRGEGNGIVKVVDARPSTKDLSDAPFRIDVGEQRAFVDHAIGVAIAPLALDQDGRLRIVVTTPERIGAYIR